MGSVWKLVSVGMAESEWLPDAKVAFERERVQCQRWAAIESPKVVQSKIWEADVQPFGVDLASISLKLALTSGREKSRAHRRLCERESDEITERAESSHDMAEGIS
jgi:hypothetical protein